MATEKRLIYLDEAIAKVKDDGVLGEGHSDDERIDDVIDILESCYTVDAVEIVHSKWVWIPVAGVMKFRCGNIDCCRLIPFGCSPDDLKYCPYCGSIMDGKKI
jgi:hypothetical protein